MINKFCLKILFILIICTNFAKGHHPTILDVDKYTISDDKRTIYIHFYNKSNEWIYAAKLFWNVTFEDGVVRKYVSDFRGDDYYCLPKTDCLFLINLNRTDAKSISSAH